MCACVCPAVFSQAPNLQISLWSASAECRRLSHAQLFSSIPILNAIHLFSRRLHIHPHALSHKKHGGSLCYNKASKCAKMPPSVPRHQDSALEGSSIQARRSRAETNDKINLRVLILRLHSVECGSTLNPLCQHCLFKAVIDRISSSSAHV